LAAGARVLRTAGGIGGVPVEPLLQCSGGDLQRPVAHGCFQCFEIEVFNGFYAQKILDFFDQAAPQRPGERRFFLPPGRRPLSARAVVRHRFFR
jgi:hypothetical protein